MIMSASREHKLIPRRMETEGGKPMFRRLIVAAAVLIVVMSATAAGLAQTWPECLTGCTAGDVYALDPAARLRFTSSGCVVSMLIHTNRQNTYCITASTTVTYTNLSGVVVSTQAVATIDYLAGGDHVIDLTTISCIPGTPVTLSDIYFAWRVNAPADPPGCLGTCDDYGPNSKCNGETEDQTAQPLGSILVLKDAIPNDAQDFSFTASGGLTPGSFSLDDDADGTLPNVQIFNDVAPGTYTITEGAASGWTLTTVTSVGTAAHALVSGGVQLTFAEGDYAIVTFTNQVSPGSITVHKFDDLNGSGVQGAGEPDIEGWSFSLYSGSGCSGDAIATGATDVNGDVTFSSLTPGDYSVGETLPAGWENTAGGTCQNASVAAGGSESLTFGNRLIPGSITVHKFDDLNGSGVQGAGEPDIEGWSFSLYAGSGCSGDPIATGATDANGDVTFSSLTPGDYSVGETLPAGWENTAGGTCQNVTLVAGGRGSLTFGNRLIPGSITVHKFDDVDGNGSQGTGEPDIEGWSFSLYNGSGCSGDPIATGATDANGDVTFSSLTPGDYSVGETLPSGWENTTGGTCRNVTLAAGGNDSLIFGNRLIPGSITVHKFSDDNGNGVQDAGEPALQGWDFNLYSGSACSGDPLDTGATDASGNVTFGPLTPGDYAVGETLLGGWQSTTGGTCQSVTLAASGSLTVTFGNQQIPGSIAVHKYNDLNGNGSNDAEPALGGWTINLHSASGCLDTPIASATTDSNGNVTFTDLSPGTYYVGEVLQAGWENTDPGTSPPCVEVTLSAEGSPSIDLGNRQLPGAITIQKVTIPATSEDFTFTHDEIAGGTSFPLANGETEVFGSVPPGTYVFTESSLPANWSILSIAKASGDALVRFGSSGSFHNAPYVSGDNQVEITVGPNQSALIVFTNEQVQQEEFGTIIVSKDVVPDDASTWTITLNGGSPQTLADGSSHTYTLLTPGDYTVAESGPPGYDPLVSAGSSGGSAATSIVVNVGPGDIETVAFTNTLRGQQDDGGGGGGGGASSGCYNNNPIPNAGADQVGCVGQRICLDGSASYDPDEDLPESFPGSAGISPMYRHQPRETLQFHWTFAIHHYENGRAVLSIPRGSRVLETIEGFDTEFPCFTPDLPGEYTLILTVTDDYGASLMDRVTVIVEECDHLETRRFPSGWQLVSAPLHVADTSVGTMSGFHGSQLQLFRYFGDYIAADSFTLGVGYWLYAPEPISLSITGLPVESSFSIHLSATGWHLVGVPFPAAWDQARVEFDRQTWNVDEAAQRGIIEDLCIGAAADGTYTQVDALLPWSGYWVYTHEPNVVLHLRQMSVLPAPLFWTAPPAMYTPPGPPQLSAGSAELNVSPNPSRYQPVLFSVGGMVVVDEIRVRIYDMAGHLVWDGSASEREMVWDTVRGDGHAAARGAYIYIVEIRHGSTWSLAGRDVLLLSPAD